jgi:hypothetical protein
MNLFNYNKYFKIFSCFIEDNFQFHVSGCGVILEQMIYVLPLRPLLLFYYNCSFSDFKSDNVDSKNDRQILSSNKLLE